jgi:alpha(1,3/1,4) fucosyltransferase
MKKIALHPYRGSQFLNNQIFKLDIFRELKYSLQKNNIEINTVDLLDQSTADLIVHFDVPHPHKIHEFTILKKYSSKSILFCFEPPIVNPFNYMRSMHGLFKKIYTWNDDLVDNYKYFKFHWPQSSSGLNIKAVPFNKKKFLLLINGNKLPFAPFALLSTFGKELYSERIKAIEYFEKMIPNKFSLYGRGWNQPKKLNLKERLFGFKKYRTYKGEVADKLELMSKYKYSICFENLTDVNGYITEKIFDSLKARCVPVYWGSSNITNYIPKNCFIDYREFGSYQKLLAHLESINEQEYKKYLSNIDNLLKSTKFRGLWLEDNFINIFLKEIGSH